MKCLCSQKRFGRALLQLALFLVFCVLPAFSVLAQPAATAAHEEIAHGELPQEIGEVIFDVPGEPGKQIYIIGHSHRSAISGANGLHTVKAQAEVYRIGEWLIQTKKSVFCCRKAFSKRRQRQ